MRQYGLGVSACVSADCATWWLMSSRSATCSKYENAFQEALADAVWVATHARVAREAMRAAVRDAAFVMEIMWEIAMKIPETRQSERWAATSRHAEPY